MKRESGFTLVEIIVTLVLVGLLALMAGTGIVAATRGYLFASANADTAAKAQLALARMSRELMDLKDIPSTFSAPTASSIAFFNGLTSVAFGQNGNRILLATSGQGVNPNFAAGNVLTDQVQALNFQYLASGNAAWTPGMDIQRLSRIVITLTMAGAGDGRGFTFSTTVSPRNNGNLGGAPPPPNAGQAPPGFNCFVATAAYGNQFHPMVIILKQFRDEYLATWAGGRAFIRFYYREGPSLASMIQDRPWARTLARGLLLPFVGASFLLVYAKGSIPLFIFIIVFSIWLIRHYSWRGSFMKKSKANLNEKGSVLVGLIVTMVIMAILGAALVSFTSSSRASHVADALSQQSYYLAESGLRYVAGEYVNVHDTNNNGLNDEQNQVLSGFTGRTLTFGDNSTIRLAVSPSFYVAAETTLMDPTPQRTLRVRFAGNDPGDDGYPDTLPYEIPRTGWIQIVTQTRPNVTTDYTPTSERYRYTAFNVATRTFTLAEPLKQDVPAWTSITVLARPNARQTVILSKDITKTDNRLTLTKPAGSGFHMPQYNGRFSVMNEGGQPVSYEYAYRTVDDAATSTTLYGVYCAQALAVPPERLVVTPATDIAPNDYITLKSIGTAGKTSRTWTFVTAIDRFAMRGGNEEITYLDPIKPGVQPGDEDSHWYKPVHGTYTVGDVGEGGAVGTARQALEVSSGAFVIGTDKYFTLLPLKWSKTWANFWGAWYNNDDTLSYDAQVKVKIDEHTESFYQAGMVFRVFWDAPGGYNYDFSDSDLIDLDKTSMFGLSFMRGFNGKLVFDIDGMFDGAVPENNAPMIVLWKKELGGNFDTRMKWIAYKRLDRTYFHGGNGTLENGKKYWITGEESGARVYAKVYTSDSGVTGQLSPDETETVIDFNWKKQHGYFEAGEKLKVLSHPDLNIFTNNASGGFWIKDENRSAESIDCKCTSGAEPQPGDIIYQPGFGVARVVEVIDVSGGWAGGVSNWVDCLLSRTDVTIRIDQYQDLNNDTSGPNAYWSNAIAASYAQSPVEVATVSQSLYEFLNRDNLKYIKNWLTLVLRLKEKKDASGTYVNDIQVYLGDIEGHPTAGGSPLDNKRSGNSRWSLDSDALWPPETGTTNVARDHFTLVQGWILNPSQTAYSLTDNPGEPSSVIRTTEFLTPKSGNYAQVEMGLQTAGINTGSKDIQFDDFAVRLIGSLISLSQGFVNPMQY